ncbi:hypothetical protein [Streptomyces sp. NPDC055287]
MTFSWPEITPDIYDAVRRRVGWEEDSPGGCVLHTAWFVSDGLNVLDIWESQDHFNRFIAARVAPVLKGELGVQRSRSEVLPATPALRRPRGQRRRLLTSAFGSLPPMAH